MKEGETCKKALTTGYCMKLGAKEILLCNLFFCQLVQHTGTHPRQYMEHTKAHCEGKKETERRGRPRE